MNSPKRQQTRDRRAFFIHAPVGQNQDAIAAVGRLLRLLAKFVERFLEPLSARRRVEQHRQRLRPEPNPPRSPFSVAVFDRTRLADAAQSLEFPVGQQRQLDPQHVRVLGRFIQQIPLRADVSNRRHHQLFADRVDRRIGDLREKLLEIVEQELGTIRQAGQRNIDAHRADRLLAHCRHRGHQDSLVFHRVAEDALALEQRVEVGAVNLFGLGQIIGMDQLLVEPLAIGLSGGVGFLDLLVLDDAAFLGVDQEHASRLQASLVADIRRLDTEHARFRRHDNQVIVGDVVARGPQPVAVEHAADVASVGKDDGGWAVPGLHHRGVVLVEGLLVVLHVLV